MENKELIFVTRISNVDSESNYNEILELREHD